MSREYRVYAELTNSEFTPQQLHEQLTELLDAKDYTQEGFIPWYEANIIGRWLCIDWTTEVSSYVSEELLAQEYIREIRRCIGKTTEGEIKLTCLDSAPSSTFTISPRT